MGFCFWFLFQVVLMGFSGADLSFVVFVVVVFAAPFLSCLDS